MFKVLVKKQFLEIFKSYFYDAKRNKMRSKATIALWFAFFVIVIVFLLGGMFTALALTLCAGLANAGVGWLYFAIMAGISILMGVFGAVFNSYSALYVAKDNDLLLSLPIPLRDLIASRLVSVYLLGVLYSAVAMVPTLVVYWVLVRPGAVAVICGIALFVIVSFIVLVLSCLLGWVVARISLKLKNKSLITVFIVIAAIALYYVIYFWASVALKDLLLNAVLYGAQLKGSAYVIYLFGSVGEGNLAATAACLAVTAVLVALTWRIMSRSYLSIVSASAKTKKARYVEKTARQRSPFRALFGKELAKYLSSSNYILNTSMGILFMLAAGVAILLNAHTINAFLSAAGVIAPGDVAVVACGALCLIAGMNDIAAPSVSLEGKSIWLLQSLPVAQKTVLRSKAALHFVLIAVPLAFVIVCIAIAVDLSAHFKVLMGLASFAYVALMTMVASALGVKMANLSWTNEIMPIKQGAAATIAMLGGMGLAVVLAVLFFLARLFISAELYLVIWVVVCAAAAFMLLRWLDTKGSRLFAEL